LRLRDWSEWADLIIYFWHGPESALQFLAGYLIEKSLSVDDLFVFLLLFLISARPRKIPIWDDESRKGCE